MVMYLQEKLTPQITETTGQERTPVKDLAADIRIIMKQLFQGMISLLFSGFWITQSIGTILSCRNCELLTAEYCKGLLLSIHDGLLLKKMII